MVAKIKVMKRTSTYIEAEAYYQGYPIQIRYYNNGRTKVRFTDAFAQANGYKDRMDFIRKHHAENAVIITGNPDWLEITPNGYLWEKKIIQN